jgi:hypothetical protein
MKQVLRGWRKLSMIDLRMQPQRHFSPVNI